MASPSIGLPGAVSLCLFDLDYTLIELMLDPIGVQVEVLREAGCPIPRPLVRASYDAAWDDYLQAGYRRSTQAEAYLHVVRRGLVEMGVDDDEDLLALRIHERINDVAHMSAYDDSSRVLETVRNAGFRVALATGRWHDPGPDLNFLHLATCFDRVYHSGEFGHQKDDSRFWEAVLADAGVPAASILLVDDSPEAVRTARESGLHALTIRREGSPLAFAPDPDLRSLEELLPLLGIAGA